MTSASRACTTAADSAAVGELVSTWRRGHAGRARDLPRADPRVARAAKRGRAAPTSATRVAELRSAWVRRFTSLQVISKLSGSGCADYVKREPSAGEQSEPRLHPRSSASHIDRSAPSHRSPRPSAHGYSARTQPPTKNDHPAVRHPRLHARPARSATGGRTARAQVLSNQHADRRGRRGRLAAPMRAGTASGAGPSSSSPPHHHVHRPSAPIALRAGEDKLRRCASRAAAAGSGPLQIIVDVEVTRGAARPGPARRHAEQACSASTRRREEAAAAVRRRRQ